MKRVISANSRTFVIHVDIHYIHFNNTITPLRGCIWQLYLFFKFIIICVISLDAITVKFKTQYYVA